MSILKGGDLMLFIGGTSIGYATNHTLSINADTKETSSKDSGGKWQTSEAGILSWSASSENLMSNDQAGVGYTQLIQYMLNRTQLMAHFDLKAQSSDTVPSGGWTPMAIAAGSTYSVGYRGTVIITSVELNAQNGENATFTVNFTGVGALTPTYRVAQQANTDPLDGGQLDANNP